MKSLCKDFSDCPDIQPPEIDYKGIKFDLDLKRITNLLIARVEL